MARTPAAQKPKCPRCDKSMSPKPALSRTDNRTLICRNCGREESVILFHGGAAPGKDDWPISYAF